MIYEKKCRGFSIFEVLVSIIVLILLVIGSYLVLPKLIDKAYDARRKSDLNKIKISLEFYYDFEKRYPEELPDCGQPFVYKDQTLLPSFPCDPVTKQPYFYQTKKIDSQSFRIYAMLENLSDVSISQSGCSGGCGADCSYNYGVSSTNIGLVSCSYVCAPGGGKTGSCEIYNDPSISLCPKLYGSDSTCNNECNDSKNRCKNASGKNIPY